MTVVPLVIKGNRAKIMFLNRSLSVKLLIDRFCKDLSQNSLSGGSLFSYVFKNVFFFKAMVSS